MRILFFLMLTVLCFSFACNKQDDSEKIIEGKVYDSNTGEFVEGVKIVLSSTKLKSGVYNSAYSKDAETHSGSGGSFAFDLDISGMVDFRLDFTKTNYFDESTEFHKDDMADTKILSEIYTIYPEAYLRFIAENTYPIKTSDLLEYYISEIDLDCALCCTSNSVERRSVDGVDEQVCKVYGNQIHRVNWVVLEALLSSYDTLIYCPAFDTTTLYFYY